MVTTPGFELPNQRLQLRRDCDSTATRLACYFRATPFHSRNSHAGSIASRVGELKKSINEVAPLWAIDVASEMANRNISPPPNLPTIANLAIRVNPTRNMSA